MTLGDALTYVPVELPFGTSGLRALAADMTDLECYANVAGFIAYAMVHDRIKRGETVCVAGDLRSSTPRITRAVIAAISDAGCAPEYCGLIPTPALASHAFRNHRLSIMVTGSHIPADRNGIKFHRREGEALKEDETPIREAVADVRRRLYASPLKESRFNPDGSLKDVPALPAIDGRAEAEYRQRYAATFPATALRGKTVVVYQQSAVGRDLLVQILESCGARVIPIERSDVFIPIDTENITPADDERFHAFSKRHPDAFAIVSADGDSDRPIVVDERGLFHRGDMLGCIAAAYVGAQAAAVPISSSDGVDRFCRQNRMQLTKTKIGSPYVISAMMQAAAAKQAAVSWEVNGGFLTGTSFLLQGHELPSLPTRDAALPILTCLVTAAQRSLSLSELFGTLPQRFTSAALIDDVAETKIKDFRDRSADKEIMLRLAEAVATRKHDALQGIDTTDGLRIRFASNDVLHFRPSGNAPQFRVYSDSDSQEQADMLAEQAVAPGGYIEQLLATI